MVIIVEEPGVMICDAVEPALRQAVAHLDPTTRALASYHLGWTEADGTPRPYACRTCSSRPT